ncbi:hypothetical protein FPCIR_12927 [Fusarium pseudocircinatum]|uniref:Uncharacterized protein n=1 Tax=Fusarium pseudocircinatum TaxID=56676 RepID=A0A8H5KNY8_9HYPO|nr:hypothetical protein FPCIR_12927 [Fusarium pseudocircinatum]
MVSGTPPDPSRYTYSPRDFISAYLEYAGNDATAKWDNCVKLAFDEVMESLKDKGLTQASHDWLEYEADRIAWHKLSSKLDIKAPEWPFTIPTRFDTPNKIANGISPTYQKWRLDRGLPIYDTANHADSKPTALSLDQREIIWKDNRKYHHETAFPITGPFQIVLPKWINAYHLVLEEDDGILSNINNEIVRLHLAVSWNYDDEARITLVVGLSPTTCVNPEREGVDDSIQCLWRSVVDWAIGAYFGATMSLATFLRVRKAVPVADDIPYHGQRLTTLTSEAWADIHEDPVSSMSAAHKKRKFIAQCRSEVLEIIQKPLIEAKAELSRWVVDGYYDDRLEAAREIWLSSTTDERTIQEVCAWAWGPHDMAIISAENPSAENDSSTQK